MLVRELSERNQYEEERAARIRRNTEVLQQLGLLDNPISGAAAEAAGQRQAAARRQQRAVAEGTAAAPPEPMRRSRRLQGVEVENGGIAVRQNRFDKHPLECSSRAAGPAVQVDMDALEAAGSDPAMDVHNVMRVRSMSERALQTRIWRIKRVDKLYSFVKVLEACDKEDLAAEAKEALRQMCGGQLPESFAS